MKLGREEVAGQSLYRDRWIQVSGLLARQMIGLRPEMKILNV